MDLAKDFNKLTNESGVYMIIDTESGKKYIGSTVNIKARVQLHISNWMNSLTMYKVITENIRVKTIELCSEDNLLERELFHIKNENSIFPNGFNVKCPITKLYLCKKTDHHNFVKTITQDIRRPYYRVRELWYSENRELFCKTK